MHRYRAYGLSVASELELPELLPDPDGTAEPDVRIRLGGVPETIGEPTESTVTWDARPGAWRHEIAGVARYSVHDGAEVRVEPTGGDAADVRAFLFASTLGAVLHQRGLFVLHASTIVGDGGAVAVAGGSGTGKSTTLAELAGRGHAVLSDDKTVVRFGDDGPEALSGFPALRLWRDAVERIGEAPSALPAVREGMDKFLYRAPVFRTEPAPLRAVVVLRRAHAAELSAPVEAERLAPHRAVRALLRQTYRRRIVSGSGLRAEHFQWAARLADAVPVVFVHRARTAQTVEAVGDAVERVLAEAGG